MRVPSLKIRKPDPTDGGRVRNQRPADQTPVENRKKKPKRVPFDKNKKRK